MYNHVHVCNLILWPSSTLHDEEIRRLGDKAVCIRCTCTMSHDIVVIIQLLRFNEAQIPRAKPKGSVVLPPLQEVAEILGEDGSTYQDSNIFLKGTQSANPHNDYSQHFVDTGQRSQNFIRDVGGL